LDRPDVRNAYNAATRDALLDALSIASADPGVTGIVLDGAGPAFCSGGDLDEFGTLTDPATAHVLRVARSVAHAVHEQRDRTTVHVHGACIGAGVEVPAFAGRVVARGDATFRLPEVSMGLVPGAGGTVSLPRRIGRHRTAWMAVTGAVVDAPTALEWGLVDELI
jgi:enoyl-CoA hydratase/carnithine racemase